MQLFASVDLCRVVADSLLIFPLSRVSAFGFRLSNKDPTIALLSYDCAHFGPIMLAH